MPKSFFPCCLVRPRYGILHTQQADLPRHSSRRRLSVVYGEESDYPSPEDVRARAKDRHRNSHSAYRPDPGIYLERKLIVKWGTYVGVTEGQCVWLLEHHMKGKVPVSKIYGWKRDGRQTFLYLELVDGERLDERWPQLMPSEKRAVCRQLHRAVKHWRRIQAPKSYLPLASISGAALRDVYFEDSGVKAAGPFANARAFHDAFAKLAVRRPADYTDPRKEIEELSGFDDKVHIVFSHGDLDQGNILLSRAGEGPCRLVAVIDWHQAGWYPAPWEWLKAQGLAMYYSEWVKKDLPRFLKPAKFPYYRSFEYVRMSTI